MKSLEAAGHDARGQALWVAVVDVEPRAASESGDAAPDGDAADGGPYVDEDDDGELGRSYEYWLATMTERDGQRFLVSLRLIFSGKLVESADEVQRDQVGATIELGANRLAFAGISVGASWSDMTKRYQLSPLRLLSESHDSTEGGGHTRFFDWQRFQGFSRYSVERCPEQDADADEWDTEPDYEHYEYLALPVLPLPEAYTRGGWRQVAIADCGARLSAGRAGALGSVSSSKEGSSLAEGYLIHGATDSASDASMRVVMSSQTQLYVEVDDDVWITRPGRQWHHADHLEIWLGKRSVACYREGERSKTLWQWGVLVGSGKVVPAYGKPTQPLMVEHQPPRDGQPARFAITLPADLADSEITLVYSDSDDGQRQEYLLATSQFRYGHADFLGIAERYSWDMSCRISDGALRLHDGRPAIDQVGKP